MKKLLIVLIMITTAATMQAQSQLKTVRGKTKDGKTVSVQYYKGTSEDNIESIKYQVVDELEARVKVLQNDTKDLQAKLNTANKQIKQLQQQLEESKKTGENEALQAALDEKIEEVNALNTQMEDLNVQLQLLNEEKAGLLASLDSVSNLAEQRHKKENYDRPEKTPIVGVEINAGPVLYGNTVNEDWQTPLQLSKQATVYFGTARLLPSFPLSVEAGINIHQMAMTANRAGYEKTIEGLQDVDGDPYDAHYTYSDLSEKLTQTYLGIPIRLCFGQPVRNKVSVYAKLGVTPSFRIINKFEGNGSYTLTGEYKQFDITLSDIEELGFVSNAPCYTDELVPETKAFVVWGNAALGACVPFGQSPIQLNLGIKVDYSLTSIGKATEVDVLPDGTGLLQNNGRVIVPAATVGIIYTLK